MISMFITVLLFMSPIFYPISVVPEAFRSIYLINPITFAVEMIRDVLFFGNIPDPVQFGVFTITALIFSTAGFFWFQRTRKGFADVL